MRGGLPTPHPPAQSGRRPPPPGGGGGGENPRARKATPPAELGAPDPLRGTGLPHLAPLLRGEVGGASPPGEGSSDLRASPPREGFSLFSRLIPRQDRGQLP